MATQTESTVSDEPHEPMLVPVLSAKFALRRIHLLVTFVFGSLLVLLCYLPLRHTDLWGHVIYGRWMAAHRMLPTNDPIMPLAEGMPMVDTLWLSQVILAQVESHFGAIGLSNLFAMAVWSTFLLIARACYLQSRGLGTMLVCTAVALGVGWSRVATIRPEMFSLACLAILLWLMSGNSKNSDARLSDDLSATRPNKLLWFAVPPLFALWANLHGTFVCGLALLFATAAGRAIDLLVATRSPRAMLADRAMRGWLWLAEAAAAATLINPYGFDLWIEVARFGNHPVLRDVAEWNPLVVLGIGGREFAIATVLLMFVARWSRRSFSAREVLWLAIYAYLAAVHVRMIGWFAPVLATVLARHVGELFARWFPQSETDDAHEQEPGELPPGRSFRYSLACLTLAWIFFAFSPLSKPLLGGKPRSEASLFGDAPRKLTDAESGYLVQHPPKGLVYCPQWWGDWIAWRVPGARVFASTHMHLLPRQAWLDYRRITNAESGWDAALDRYQVEMLVIDKENQPVLASAITRAPGWLVKYDDPTAIVVVRASQPPSPQDRVPDPTTPVAAPDPAPSDD